MKIKLAFKLLYSKFVSFFAEAIIEGFYGGFFQYKSNAKKVSSLYISYLKNYNSFIGFNAKFKSPPITAWFKWNTYIRKCGYWKQLHHISTSNYWKQYT